MKITLEYKKEDLWIGAFWRKSNLWICIIPMLPIHFEWNTLTPEETDNDSQSR